MLYTASISISALHCLNRVQPCLETFSSSCTLSLPSYPPFDKIITYAIYIPTMAAAVGIVGSIISVLQLSAKVVKYLAATKDASVDCQRLLLEIQSVTGLLYMLKERLAGAGSETLPWTHSLDAPEGPVTQFRQALEELVPKLLPAEGWKKVGKTLSWPFKKEEIMAILGRIERQKSLFGLALENDHL